MTIFNRKKEEMFALFCLLEEKNYGVKSRQIGGWLLNWLDAIDFVVTTIAKNFPIKAPLPSLIPYPIKKKKCERFCLGELIEFRQKKGRKESPAEKVKNDHWDIDRPDR